VKREIPSPRRESNPITPIVQPVVQRYTDWAITALYKNNKSLFIIIIIIIIIIISFPTEYEGVSKSFRTGRLERELQMVQLSTTRCSCITIL
jgi:hypothetical protein